MPCCSHAFLLKGSPLTLPSHVQLHFGHLPQDFSIGETSDGSGFGQTLCLMSASMTTGALPAVLDHADVANLPSSSSAADPLAHTASSCCETDNALESQDQEGVSPL